MARWVGPKLSKQIGDELKKEFETAEQAISRGFSAMGDKSATMRDVAEVEGLVAEGALDQYPELQMFLESMNPDLYDTIMQKIRDNPDMIRILYERWGHLFNKGDGEPQRERPGGSKYPRV